MIQGGNQVETDPTEEQVKAEIAAAVKILRDDGVHIHKTYSQFQKSVAETEGKPEDKPDKEGKPPPVKETADNDPPIRKGLWWGTRQ